MSISTSTENRLLLNRFRAAELLSISLRFLDAQIRKGTLVPVRLGRRTLFQRSELERFIAENARSRSQADPA